MFATIIPIKLATALMTSWLAASSPVPLPAAAIGLMLEQQVASPIEMVVHDPNRGGIETKIVIERDGSYDEEMGKRIAHVFRCRTDQEHAIAKRTLAMVAAVAERYGKPIDLVSGYRVRRGESWTSPHRAARAIDFRIRDVPLREVRDWVWRNYSGIGVGWYPGDQFLHVDSREQDTAWTEVSAGRNNYKPYWAVEARQPAAPARRGPGV